MSRTLVVLYDDQAKLQPSQTSTLVAQDDSFVAPKADACVRGRKARLSYLAVGKHQESRNWRAA